LNLRPSGYEPCMPFSDERLQMLSPLSLNQKQHVQFVRHVQDLGTQTNHPLGTRKLVVPDFNPEARSAFRSPTLDPRSPPPARVERATSWVCASGRSGAGDRTTRTTGSLEGDRSEVQDVVAEQGTAPLAPLINAGDVPFACSGSTYPILTGENTGFLAFVCEDAASCRRNAPTSPTGPTSRWARTQSSQDVLPPRERGTTWSMLPSFGESLRPVYWQTPASRSQMPRPPKRGRRIGTLA